MNNEKINDEKNIVNIFDLMLAALLSVSLGVAYWGWTFVYEITNPLFAAIGLKYLLAGFWIISAILPALIIRKPGIAFFSSLLSAIIEGLISNWGLMAGAWGAIQGLGAELVFLLFFYRNWNWSVVVLASIISSSFSYLLDFFYYRYSSLSITINCLQLLSFIISSVLFAAIISIIISKKLLKTGLLNNFKIAKN